jgi:uncharacterized protein YndB with AHSA1/START domain
MSKPDLTARPHAITVERVIEAPIDRLYWAWTTRMFGRWFAEPDSLTMRDELNAPFFFETVFEGARHAHYGRFLRLDFPSLIEMTWVNAQGTHGEETVVTVKLNETAHGTLVELTHAGLPNEEMRDRHEAAWPLVLAKLADAAHSVDA